MKTKQLPRGEKIENEAVEFLLEKSEKTFQRNLFNMDKIDSKFVQLLIFISAIIALFLKFIQLPKEIIQLIIYAFIVVSFLLALLFAFFGYRTNKYKSVDINQLIKKYEEEKDFLDIKKVFAGTTGENINKIKKINFKKGRFFDMSFFFVLLGIILTFILNLLQGGQNV